MKKLIFIVMCIFAVIDVRADEYFFAEVTQNANLSYFPLAGRSESWVGDYPLVERAGYFVDLKDNFYFSAQYMHGSSLFLGKPFNDKEETSFNFIGATIGYKWR